MTGNLLTLIAERNHCYISDLHFTDALAPLFENIDLESYSIEEWSYTISYILGRDISFQNYHEISEYIYSK